MLNKSVKITLILFLLLTACSSADHSVKGGNAINSNMPKWVFYYDGGKKTCGVGISRPHIRGVAYQRVVAISRAIDEIARQQGVTVNTELASLMSGSQNGATSRLSTYSVQTSTGKTVEAKIIDTYMDEKSDDFYVLMCDD
jgi:hypothetical protein